MPKDSSATYPQKLKTKTFGFPKAERLKSNTLITQMFASGKAINAYPLKLLYLKTPLPQPVPFQLALVVPKRKFKSAVKRNRIKRLLREAYRLHKPLFFNNTEAQYALVILYLGKEMPPYTLVATKMNGLLQKFNKRILDEETSKA